MSLTPDELGKKIKEARESSHQNSSDKKKLKFEEKSSTAKAMRAGTDLVAAIIVGGFLGYWIDEWLNIKPFAMIFLLFMGFGAGFLNIYRAETGQDYKVGFKEDKNDEE